MTEPNDAVLTGVPAMELSMSNSMLNIRTCADSCVALMKIIKYFASDGDMCPQTQHDLDQDSTECQQEVQLPSLSISDENIAAGVGVDHLDSLMADAMID